MKECSPFLSGGSQWQVMLETLHVANHFISAGKGGRNALTHHWTQQTESLNKEPLLSPALGQRLRAEAVEQRLGGRGWGAEAGRQRLGGRGWGAEAGGQGLESRGGGGEAGEKRLGGKGGGASGCGAGGEGIGWGAGV